MPVLPGLQRPSHSASLLIAVSLALALPACGSASSTERGETGTIPALSRAKPFPHGGSVALKKIGQFDHPVYVTGAPGFPKLLFVVEQPGRVAVLSGGHRLSHPFLDIRGMVGYDEAERGLLSIAFPRLPPATEAPTSTASATPGNIRIDEFKRGSATRANRGSQRRVIEIPIPKTRTTTAASCSSSATCSTSARATAAPAATRPTTPRTRESCSASWTARSTCGLEPPAPTIGAEQPLRRQARPRRDLQLRAAQSLPLLLRHRHPRTVAPVGDRRRRPEQLGGGDYTTVAAASGANFGWDARGLPHTRTKAAARRTPATRPKPIFAYSHSRAGGSCSIIGGYVVADPSLPSLHAYSKPTTRGRLRSADHLGRHSTSRASGEHKPASLESPTSFGRDDACGHVYVGFAGGSGLPPVPAETASHRKNRRQRLPSESCHSRHIIMQT